VRGQLHDPAVLPPGKRPGTQCTIGWMNAENLSTIEILSPDSPASRESLCRLRYTGPHSGIGRFGMVVIQRKGCTSPGCQIAVATKFCIVVPDICGNSV
jgi:hypothetical protein